MGRKIFGFFYKETHSLNQAALLLGLFAFLSQVLAFLRDRLLAHIFGASETLDIYYAAFRVPDFIFVTVASVVSLSVLVPFIIEKEGEGREELKKFINNIFSFFSLLIIAVAGLAYILMPHISGLLFKGLTPMALEKSIQLSRILLFSPVILGFSNLFGSLTQAFNRFTIYALSPLVYNAGIIFGIIFLAERIGIQGVVIGVIIGALFHALVQVPFVISTGLFPKLSLHLNFSSIKRVATISVPRTLTLSMTHIATIFLVSMASLMPAGSISILSFSINLQSVPLSIIGVSYSLAAFPTLSRKIREKNVSAFLDQIATTAKLIIFWSLPLTALFIILRAQIVRVILGSGSFDWEDTRLTAAAVALFAISSMFQCLLLLFMRGFYSAGFTKKPFVINLISTLAIFLSSWGLVKFFYTHDSFKFFISSLLKVEDLPSTVVLMLPLAFTIGSVLNGLLHWVMFERQFKGFTQSVVKTLFQCFGSAVIMGAVAYGSLRLLDPVLNTSSLVGIFLQGALAGVIAIVVGVLVLFLMGNAELREVYSALKDKFWRSKVIATDPEIV